MNFYIQKLNQYITDNPLIFSDQDIGDILDFLWWTYTEEHPVDNDNIREQFSRLREVWDSLSDEAVDKLFAVTCTLCLEYERLAFREGMKVGMHLYAAK